MESWGSIATGFSGRQGNARNEHACGNMNPLARRVRARHPSRPGTAYGHRAGRLVCLATRSQGPPIRLFESRTGNPPTLFLALPLDDAFTLCKQGMLSPAREQAEVFAGLFDRVAGCIRGVLRAVCEHGRDFGTLPNVAPLHAAYFHSERAQQIARTNSLFFVLDLTCPYPILSQAGGSRASSRRPE